MIMTMLAALALAGAGPGEERRFGDWVVTCDNVARCEASLLLMPPSPAKAAAGPDLALLSRDAGPAGAMTIAFRTPAKAIGVIGIWIDQRQMGSGVLRDGAVTLTGEAAEGMARAMANGKLLTLRSGKRVLARYSLAGASATLRYVDAEQGRAGGTTALVAKGPKSVAAVPAARVLPRVNAVRPGKGKAGTLDAGALGMLATQGPCDPATLEAPGFERLDARATLVLVPCRTGDNDVTHLAFVLRGGKTAPAPFDSGVAGKPMELANYGWSNGTLRTEPFLPGPGGCGVARHWVWDGTQFRTVLVSHMTVCGRDALWTTAYRAEPVWR